MYNPKWTHTYILALFAFALYCEDILKLDKEYRFKSHRSGGGPFLGPPTYWV